MVLVATRKGAWLFHGDAARKTWRADGPHFLGHIINHLVLDPRDGRTLLAAAKTGHLGPTIFRSTDLGRSWKEAARPPAFAKAPEGEKGRTVDHTFWLTPGHASEPDVWYAGTSPQGLFRSEDGGVTWEPFSAINDDPQYRDWMGGEQDGTPDGPKMHSIIVDPRDPTHIYFGMSGGGVHESLDGGPHLGAPRARARSRGGLRRANITFHDPHCVRLCPSNPDRLYQQNHCGIYRSTGRRTSGCASARRCRRASATSAFRWSCIRATPTPPGCSRWTARRCGRAPARTASPPSMSRATAARAGSASTTACRKSQAWWTVKRQAMTADAQDPVGLYFGTTSGESVDEPRRRRALERRSRGIFPKSTRWRPPKRADEGADPDAAAFLHAGDREVEADGATLAELLADLDRRYPGICASA